jgi:lipid-binding SYLF domain-containing protein
MFKSLKSQLLPLLLLLSLTTSLSTHAASKDEIDAKVQETIDRFYKLSSAGKQLSDKAQAMLVFPDIVKAGFIFGGEYGEGALIKKGVNDGYYNIVSGSFGWQLGVQFHSQIILFMTKEELDKFKKGNGWDAGFGGSIAVVNTGASKEFTIDTIKEPVIAFIFSEKGLMGNLTLEGSKVSKIER